jgi:hypothetical protein
MMRTMLKLQSRQEEILESFMEQLFGAPFLYVLEKRKRGKSGVQEPADLTWITDDLVVLFYMRESLTEILPKQIIAYNVMLGTK